MLTQIGSHPVTVFLILMAFSVFLFAAIRLLLNSLYTRFLYRWRWLAATIDKLTTHGTPPIKKYGVLGLVLFVALPVPGTGVVGGTILSWLAGFKWYTAFVAIIFASALENILTTVGITGLIRLTHM